MATFALNPRARTASKSGATKVVLALVVLVVLVILIYGITRATLVRRCGSPPSSEPRQLNGLATITGVAFFDRVHGQIGVAPNGIELHPVLSIKIGRCGARESAQTRAEQGNTCRIATCPRSRPPPALEPM